MTYDEFKRCVTVMRSLDLTSKELSRVNIKFETWCSAEYTDTRKASMEEDEFVEWVTRMFYERLCGIEFCE